jgi:phage shock protein A
LSDIWCNDPKPKEHQMSLFKRITATLSTSVDRLVGELENHDAVIEAGISDTRQAYAKAKVRHTRMSQEGERLRRKLDALRRDAANWRERALGCDDEETALACLGRSKTAAAQAESLEQTLAHHVDLETRLLREIEAVRQRIEDLEHKRQLMRSREATAEATTRIRRMDQRPHLDLDDAFERWEVKVTEAELTTGTPPTQDPLEAQFAAGEERAALQAELAALRRDRENRHED